MVIPVGIIHLVRFQIFWKTKIAYPIICTAGVFLIKLQALGLFQPIVGSAT